MIKILDITFDPEDATSYLNTLDADYQHYHWEYVKHHPDPRGLGDNNCLKSMHAYGLQTVYEDTTFPYHCDIDPHDEGPEYFKDTELVFGFFKDIKDKFKNVYRAFVMTLPPDNFIGKWTVGPRVHSKIFIPIVTNGTAWLRYFTDGQEYRVIPELGKVYQIDMAMNENYAEIINDGDSDITFIIFSILECEK
jgi:hypothetical protein